jgi:hypothetical protein
VVLALKANALKAAVGNVLDILLNGRGARAHDAARQRVVGILLLELDAALDVFGQGLLKLGRPDLGFSARWC